MQSVARTQTMVSVYPAAHIRPLWRVHSHGTPPPQRAAKTQQKSATACCCIAARLRSVGFLASNPPTPLEIPPPPRVTFTLAQKAYEIGAKENFYNFYLAPKLIYTVILWYRFVVQSPPPPPHVGGEPARQKGGEHKGGKVPCKRRVTQGARGMLLLRFNGVVPSKAM